MVLAAVRCATASSAGALPRPILRRHLAAAACVAAVAAWAPKASADHVEPQVHFKADGAGAPSSHQPTGPPAVGDGLDEVRQRIRQYGLRSVEEKLISLLRELKTEERTSLEYFAGAGAKGDDKGMRTWHSHWKSTTEKMELLQANPRKFVREHGYMYDITA